MKNTLKYYLAAYNLTAFLFWAAYFISFIAAGFRLTHFDLFLLVVAQGLAILEIVHALMRWVRSPVLSTAAQVALRLLVLAMIYLYADDIIKAYPYHSILNIGVLIVSIAWSVTELIRYSLYFLSLFDIQPAWLLWARYSFFILLYPLGVTGEWCIIISPIVAHGIRLDLYNVFVLLLAISYAYYFPVLYGYMWKQRKAKL